MEALSSPRSGALPRLFGKRRCSRPRDTGWWPSPGQYLKQIEFGILRSPAGVGCGASTE